MRPKHKPPIQPEWQGRHRLELKTKAGEAFRDAQGQWTGCNWSTEWGHCKTDLKDVTEKQARDLSERYAAIADGENLVILSSGSFGEPRSLLTQPVRLSSRDHRSQLHLPWNTKKQWAGFTALKSMPPRLKNSLAKRYYSSCMHGYTEAMRVFSKPDPAPKSWRPSKTNTRQTLQRGRIFVQPL